MNFINEIFRKARWIGSSKCYAGKPVAIDTPSLRARKTFSLDSKPASAKVYVSGLGAFVLYINGKRVGDEVLSPAFTNYTKTVLYCEYDVTEMLGEGENLVCIEVGAGFYNQSTFEGWSFCFSPWRDEEKFLLSLYADGKEVLYSSPDFRVTDDGPRLHSNIREGERYDARLRDGWLSLDFDDSGWQRGTLTRIPGGVLKKQELPPIRICEVLKPLSVTEGKNGLIYDFGRNISGVARVRASGDAGKTMKLIYGERLNDGEVNNDIVKYGVKNLDTADVQFGDRYIFKGEGVEEFAAEFVYHGFRYLEVVGARPESVEGLFIHTDLRQKGGFSSSDVMLDWFIDASNTAFLSNFHSFSEDCPHREKNGWTGDASLSCHHALFRFDMIESYRKWLGDIADCQLLSGQYPGVAPTGIYGYTWGAGPAWDSAMFVIPDAVYRECGDDSLFDGIMENNLRYLDYAALYEKEDGLVKFGLGDWCPPKKLEGLKLASNELSDSCYYYTNLYITAEALKRRSDSRAEEYFERASRLRSAILKKYLNDGVVDNDSVSSMALLLYHIPTDRETGAKIAARMVEKIKEWGYRVCCGILGVKAMFEVLDRYGYDDVAYRIMHCEDYPSFGLWRKEGLLTLPESFEMDAAAGLASLNHHMYSSPANWIYRKIGGIQNLGVAYDKCRIAPYLFDNECSAESFTETPRGKISVKWSYDNGEFSLETVIPEGTIAELVLPGVQKTLTPGENKIKIKL